MVKKPKAKDKVDKAQAENNKQEQEKQAKRKRVIDGDCRLCLHHVVPQTTGQSETVKFQTQNYTVRPCGTGKCQDKKFESRADAKKKAKKGEKETTDDE